MGSSGLVRWGTIGLTLGGADWQIEGWSPLDAFYFSSITLTTVGYGDLAPVTPPASSLRSSTSLPASA